MIWNLLTFLVAISILVTVHECGHFLVARRCGVRVERFCIGFGRTLWCCTDRHGTEYIIALIPLGGYVKMLDERVKSESLSHQNESFNNKPIWQRIAIVGAGPLANFLFAILAYWLVFMIGIPALRPVVGEISPQSIAEKAKLSPGIEIKSIDNIKTPDWESVRLALMLKLGDRQVEVSVAPFGSSQEVIKILDLRQWNFKPDKQDPILALGIVPYNPQIESILTVVQPDSAAQKAGLHVGDKIVKVDDQRLNSWKSLVKKIQENPGRPLALEIERNCLHLFLTLIPNIKKTEKGISVGFAGIFPTVLPLSEEYNVLHQYKWIPALYQASNKAWYLIRLTFSMLSKLIIGDAKLSHLSGPISIAQGAGESAESGLVYYLMFLALISINLGVINLLPLPILDGGNLLFLLIEKLNGKPVSDRIQNYSYRVGSIMLVFLMVLALFNDFSRL